MSDAITPAPPPPGTAPSESKSPLLGVVALVLSILALLFAFIGPVAWVGILLAIAALVLGIIAIKKSSKGLGITAVVIAPIALVIAIIVTLITALAVAVLTAASDEISGGQVSASVPAADGESGDSSGGAGAGTRDNPYPIGTEISNDEWTVVINSFNPDGNAAVAAGNMFNEEPAAGSHYVIVNYTVTYHGDDSSFANWVSVDLVTNDGTVIDGTESMAVLEDGFGLDELYSGGSATGSKAMLVPDGTEGVIRVSPGLFSDDVFVATS